MPQALLERPVAPVPEIVFTRSTVLWLAALVPGVLLVHGYHPFADDAGIYVAGIRKLLNPTLYQIDAPFVLANTHLSVFAHVLAWTVRLTRLQLSAVLLATHVASIYTFLLAGWSIATRLFRRKVERWFSVAFAAACFTLPAAGTALLLMDPYVTARSFATPLGLLAVAAVLDRRRVLAALFLVLAGLLHPLVFLYAAALVVLCALVDSDHAWAAVVLSAAAIAVACVVALLARHCSVSPAYSAAIHSRNRAFLFPRRWKWYEDIGLIAPLTLFALTAFRSEARGRIRSLCIACVLLGGSCALAAFLFIHSSGPYLLVRLQLLRSFQIIYLIGVLLLGGWFGRVLGRKRIGRRLTLALLVFAAGGLFVAQRAAYPCSAHVEWPGTRPRNPWAQAYRWVRENTPQSAVFAGDPNLVFRDGVDAQGFRATTARSLLADNKDQGVVAVVDPAIAGEWAAQRDAQSGLNQQSDVERVARLKPFGVTWLLLDATAVTDFVCPYRNGVAKVCRME